MTDRSSSQGLPDDWSRGSYAAHERHYGAEATDAYSAGTTGPNRVRTADSYGAGTARPDGPAKAGPFGAAAADPYGAGNAGPFGVRNGDPFAGPGGDPFGARSGDPFGDRRADPFGDRRADPFGAATTDAYRAGTADGGTGRPEAEPPSAAVRYPAPGEAADSNGFLSALFDFGFASFVTPKVIKVLYVLIMIGTVISALVFTVIAFKVSTAFGILTLVFGDPLFILIVLAIYRIILEFFVATFRAAEDIRALRERGGLR